MTVKLLRIPAVDQGDLTRYSVNVDGVEVGQVWSKEAEEEHRNWRSGMHATYVGVIYWVHNRSLELFYTRKEAVEDLTREHVNG